LVVYNKTEAAANVRGQLSGVRALLDYVRNPAHGVTTLYVFEISRIGRSFLETLDVVRRLEEECGVIVWSLSPKESWTQTTDRSIQNLMLAIFYESPREKGRTKANGQKRGPLGREARANTSAGRFDGSIGVKWLSIEVFFHYSLWKCLG
jgi:DNA invertase Pin-like site-specific DNA recombinase